VVLLPGQVEVLIFRVVSDSVEAVLLTSSFNILLECDLSELEFQNVPLLLDDTSLRVDLDNHVVIPNVAVDRAIYVLYLVHLIPRFTTLVMYCEATLHCHIISI